MERKRVSTGLYCTKERTVYKAHKKEGESDLQGTRKDYVVDIGMSRPIDKF